MTITLSYKTSLALALLPLMAACAATPPPASTTRPPATTTNLPRPMPTTAPPPAYYPPATATGGFRPAPVMSLPGIEGVIGADAASLASQFGTPRLDVREGDARKLQFAGAPCVLDVYLYPASPGAQPTATYVDARRASDGLDVDRASCIRALRGR